MLQWETSLLTESPSNKVTKYNFLRFFSPHWYYLIQNIVPKGVFGKPNWARFRLMNERIPLFFVRKFCFCNKKSCFNSSIKGLNRVELQERNGSFTVPGTDSDSDSKPDGFIALCRTCSHCTDSDLDPYFCRTGIRVFIGIQIRLRQCKWAKRMKENEDSARESTSQLHTYQDHPVSFAHWSNLM